MYSISRSGIANIVRAALTTRVASVLAVVFALPFVGGCSLLSDQVERAAKGAGKVVTYYCENVTVPEIREEVRAKVNKHAAPHSVAVTCADGGPTLDTAAPAPEPTAWLPIFIIEKWPIFFPERSANG